MKAKIVSERNLNLFILDILNYMKNSKEEQLKTLYQILNKISPIPNDTWEKASSYFKTKDL